MYERGINHMGHRTGAAAAVQGVRILTYRGESTSKLQAPLNSSCCVMHYPGSIVNCFKVDHII